MTTKSLSLIAMSAFALTAFSTSAQADAISRLQTQYNMTYYAPAERRISRVEDQSAGSRHQLPSETADNGLCQDFYQKIGGDGVIRMHLAFGYFDDSEGQPMRSGFTNLGHNAATDEAFYRIFVDNLTGRCKGNMQACRFQDMGGGKFQKVVKTPQGRDVTIVINSGFSALTPYYKVNTQDRADEQRAKSEKTRRDFLNAVKTDDVVIYLGHARNGGGPDFYPPRLKADGHPDYKGYYQAKTPGLNDLLGAVRARGEAPPLLAMYACWSEAWFGKKLYNLSPETAYIFTQSDKLSSMTEHFNATMATIDALARQQCYAGFKEELDVSATERGVHEKIRNLMTKRSPVDLGARPGK